MSVASNLHAIKAVLPPTVTLVAVSKTHPVSLIMEAYNEGQRVFGENKVQELLQKVEAMPADVEWHMIGHLQTNKVKFIVPFVALIHGVDSFKLLETINKEGAKIGRKIPCFLQVHVAAEETKFGFAPEELSAVLTHEKIEMLANIEFRGVMGMASFTDNEDQVKGEFTVLKGVFDRLKTGLFAGNSLFDTLSMGMSDDFRLAIECGSTMVRVGSSIFGVRDYSLNP